MNWRSHAVATAAVVAAAFCWGLPAEIIPVEVAA